MYFSELALQGVRNFQDTHRIPFAKGYSVFVTGPGGGKSTIVDVLLHLLYPDPTEPATQAFLSPRGGTCRVALLLETSAGERFRLVQDLAAGSMVLTRQDPASSAFANVSATPAEILQYLGSQLHLPQKDILEGIFVNRDASLPSAMPRVAAPAPQEAAAQRRGLPPSPHLPPGGAQASGPSFPGYQGMEDDGEILPDDPEEIRSQVQILERDLSSAVEVDDLQFKLDGLQSELFEIDQKLKELGHAQDQAEQLEQQLKKYEKLGALPGDFEKRVREFNKNKEKLDRDMARLDEEKDRWEKKSQEANPPPLRQNRLFMGGMALGILALAAGVAGFFLDENLRYVALLDLVGFGIAVFVAIKHIDSTMTTEKSQVRLDIIEERREKLQHQFDLESSIVRRTMIEVGVENPKDIIEQYTRRNKLLAELTEARERLEAKRQDPEALAAESKREDLQKQVDEFEAKLAGAAGMMMSPRDMEKKISLLRGKLEHIERGEPVVPPAAADPDPYGLGVGAPPGASQPVSYGEVDLGGGLPPSPAIADAATPDPCQTLMKLAVDLFLAGREQIEPMFAGRASQYIAALTSQAYSQIVFQPDGSVTCLDANTGSAVTFAMLPPAVQDLVYLGLKLTIIETFSQRQPVPVLLDDPFKRIPENTHDVIGRMLAGLGGATQVLMFCGQPGWAQHASASFQL